MIYERTPVVTLYPHYNEPMTLLYLVTSAGIRTSDSLIIHQALYKLTTIPPVLG